MDVVDQLHAVKSGKLSRRAFSKSLLGVGVGIVAMPYMSRPAGAAAADQATYFTWGGYDDPALFGEYIKKYGEAPNLATFGGSEEALTKMRSGFMVDVSHPCNADVPRWIASGLFQPLDTDKLSNWGDVIPELYQLDGIMVNGQPYMAPFDWGQTSVTYRTDLFDLEGKEESWGMLWDERYKGRLAVLASAGDAWWCGAIYAGVDFKDISSKVGFEKTAELMRKQRPLIRTYTDDETTLEQALASGEIVAAMTWNSSAVKLKTAGVKVKFANPKEGALTWVCGAMIRKDAPQMDKAYDIVNSMLSVETGKWLIGENGYGHSNVKSFAQFTDKQLDELGLNRNPAEVLSTGKFMSPQSQEFETSMNQEFEKIKAGF
ncbi:ABC transporter [Alphaproteobacteria bacterium 46_93_T64]|nr:ABC transporter [Alphaproteobacteria bacterium 46_93_T64]